MKYLVRKINFKVFKIDIVVLTVLFYLFRTTIPFLKFPFLILLIGLVLYTIINYRNQVQLIFEEFFRSFYLIIILEIILIASFLLSNKLYLIIFKDIINAIILLVLFFFMTFYIKSKRDIILLIESLTRLIVFFALLISIMLLYSFFYFPPDNEGFSLHRLGWDSLKVSLSSDYNFALVPIFIGMIGIFYYLLKHGSFLKKVFLHSMLIIYSVTIFFSGSRRGMIILACIIILLLFIQLFTLFTKDISLKKIGSNTIWFLISIIIITFLLSGFIFFTPIQVKRNVLNTIGIPVNSYKYVLSSRLHKYSTLFSELEYSYIQTFVWNEKPDPKNPEIGWSSRIWISTFPLIGENVEIVPENSIGYKMDKSCNATSWNNNAYSFTDISSFLQIDGQTENNEFYYASVYCFVSEDFDGTWVQISAEGTASGKIIQQYDFDKKGSWQKLSILFKNYDKISPVYLYWSKYGVTDFSNLKGHVIFAYPEYKVTKLDPKDPSTGWGSRISKQVFPLYGENIEIVPENAIGYKMDSTSNASSWNKNAYSFTDISVLLQVDSIISKNESYYGSVYCYVSKDFDGTWARISAEGGASGKIIQEYDLRKKGTWQKLEIYFSSTSGIPPVYLYWCKNSVTEFLNLKGYIIFAFPQYKNISKNVTNASILSNSINGKTSEFAANDIKRHFVINRSNISTKQKNKISIQKSGFFNFTNLILPVNQKKSNTNTSILFQFSTGLLIPYIQSFNSLLLSLIDKDPVRKWVSKIISEDTTYFGYKKELSIDFVSNKFIGDRITRWQFAWQIFNKEFNWKQKIFGGGFNFLNWYGYYFLKDKTLSDYPHNPFLSILLYSGIVGLFLYIFLLCKVFYYYIKYIKEYYLFFVFFLITFFFSFFSGGSPFDPPIMGFFMLLPFFIHAINKSEDQLPIKDVITNDKNFNHR